VRLLLLILRTLTATLLCVALTPLPALGQTRGEEEAARQLEFARAEVEEGNFEKALVSADSAITLNPALYDAYIYKALAYEGLGNLQMAESFLRTYLELAAAGSEQYDLADESLTRLQEKLGAAAARESDEDDAEEDAEAGTAGAQLDVPADMPELPSGSEAFHRWLLAKQQMDLYETRRNAGVSLLVSGISLAGLGGGLMGGMAAASSSDPNNANIEALYAAGMGAVFTGVALALVALPTVAINASRLSRLKAGTEASLRPRPSLELRGGALALRF